MVPTPGRWYKRWNREIVMSGIRGSRILSRVLKTNFRMRKVIPRGKMTKIPAKIFALRCLNIFFVMWLMVLIRESFSDLPPQPPLFQVRDGRVPPFYLS